MKKILVINLGWEQEPLLDTLMEYDVEIYGIHSDTNYYKAPNYKDVLIVDFRDLEKIIRYANTIKPDAVISDECDYSYFAQAVVAEMLNLPGPRIKEAQIATNKYLQRVKAQEKGLLIPSFKLCTNLEEVYQFAKENSYPIITKPVDNRGSFGVNKISNKDEVTQAFYDALANSHSRLVLVEKFIEGTHITVDGYIFQKSGTQSLAVASKEKFQDKGYIIDKEIIYPANVSKNTYDKAMRIAQATSNALGFNFGFFHGEFIVDSKEAIFLTEIANRGGGVFTSTVILPYHKKIDLLNIYIKETLSIPYAQPSDLSQTLPTIMKFFQFSTKHYGRLKSIYGIDILENNPQVLKLKLLVKKGDAVEKITNGSQRHGVIIFSENTDQHNLSHNLKTLLEILEVEIE